MSLGGSDATGEGEGSCQALPETFLEELEEGFTHLPEEVAEKILAAMEKEDPWKIGSWTVLREGLTGVLTQAMNECQAAGADPALCFLEVVEAVKKTSRVRQPKTITQRKMVARWDTWEKAMRQNIQEMRGVTFGAGGGATCTPESSIDKESKFFGVSVSFTSSDKGGGSSAYSFASQSS